MVKKVIDKIIEFFVVISFRSISHPVSIKLYRALEVPLFISRYTNIERTFRTFFEFSEISIKFSSDIFFNKSLDYWTVIFEFTDLDFFL